MTWRALPPAAPACADAEGRLLLNCAVTLRQGGHFDRAAGPVPPRAAPCRAGDPGRQQPGRSRSTDLVVARDEAETGRFDSGPGHAGSGPAACSSSAAGAGFWLTGHAAWCWCGCGCTWASPRAPCRCCAIEPADLPPWLQADRLLLRLDLARTLQQAPPAGALQAALDLADTDPQRRPALVVRALGHLPPAEAVALADRLVADLLQQERLGVLAALHVHRGEALLALGRSDDAAIDAEDLLALLGQGIAPDSMYRAKAWWWAQRAFLAARREAAAAQTLADGARWITQSALPQVPPAFIDSFLHRNAVNRDLLAAAAAARRP
jgi:hypothetical protein